MFASRTHCHTACTLWVAAALTSGCLSTPEPGEGADARTPTGDGAVADAPSNLTDAADANAPGTDARPTRVDKIAAGWAHTCALFDNGGVKCWGEGTYGRLGYADYFGYDLDGNPNDVGDDETPADAPFVNIGGPAIDITAGNYHTCALMMGGKVRCWGRNTAGQVGYAADWTDNPEREYIGDDEAPADMGDVAVGGAVQRVVAGGLHTCVLLDDDTVKCWGEQQHGKLGNPNLTESIGDDELPSTAPSIDVGGTVAQIVASNQHSCARLTDGTLRCWGRGKDGRLGYGDTLGTEGNGEPEWIGDDETPASAGAVTIGDTAIGVGAGYDHSCAILQSHEVRCWGSGLFAKLGALSEDIGDDELPTALAVVVLGGNADEVALGLDHTCARLSDLSIRCWGTGDGGRLGYGDQLTVGDNETPEQRGAVPVGGDVQQVVASDVHTCALLTVGTVRCWGSAASGRLGYGDLEDVGDDETPMSRGDVPMLP